MRWEDLFADLEGQAAAEDRAELEAEVADRTRRELARLRLVDRLRGAESTRRPLTLRLRGGADEVTGRVAGVGSDWVLVAREPAAEVLVPTAAVDSVAGLGPESAEPGSEGAVASRLGLGHALRALARDRAEVQLTTLGGNVLVGTIDRVGQDHLELAEHPAGEPRRRAGRRAVPFSSIAALATRG